MRIPGPYFDIPPNISIVHHLKEHIEPLASGHVARRVNEENVEFSCGDDDHRDFCRRGG